MLLFPAIDLFQGKAVRLFKGNYDQMTIYHENPVSVAEDFYRNGATHMHLVDLEGAKSGSTPNLSTISSLAAFAKAHDMFTEVGGGIRSMEVINTYLSAGIDRVILGTAAVQNPAFVKEACSTFDEKIAIGVDIRDGYVCVHGWTESSGLEAFSFMKSMQDLGIATVICTDISRDGAMRGTNLSLYRKMQQELSMNIIASGGVSSLEDVTSLRDMGLYGAIIGKAYYTGAIQLKTAIALATGGPGDK